MNEAANSPNNDGIANQQRHEQDDVKLQETLKRSQKLYDW